MRRIINIISVLIVIFSCSCTRKVLLEPGHHHGEEIKVRIDLDALEDADVEKGDKPDYYKDMLSSARSITVLAQPLYGKEKFSVHQIDSLEGSIWLMPGEYDIIIYTSDFYDVDGIYYRGLEEHGAPEAFTYQVKASKNNELKSYNIAEPDPLFVGNERGFAVIEGVENKLEKGMTPISYRYWFEIDVDGLDYITSAYMEIDGLYTSVFLADGTHRDDEYGTQRIETTIHKDENKIKGEFLAFGPHQDSEVKNSMVITFINGRTIRVKLDDISSEIKKLTKGGEIKIDQKIVINVGDTGSGFTPNVTDWEEVEVSIPI